MGKFGDGMDYGGFGGGGVGVSIGWGAEFGLQAVPPGKEMKMVHAGGGEMKHWGSRRVSFTAAGF